MWSCFGFYDHVHDVLQFGASDWDKLQELWEKGAS